MKNLLTILLLVAVLALAGFDIYQYRNTPKIAYVDTAKLLNEYQAMRDAKNEYDVQAAEWQRNLDTLEQEVQNEIVAYKKDAPKFSPEARKEKEKEIRSRQEQYYAYKQAIEEKAAKEEDRLGSQVITKVNAFIKEFGRKNNYDILLATNETGTIIYAHNQLDITQKVLDALNAQYIPQGKKRSGN